jgi:hypothetical protein
MSTKKSIELLNQGVADEPRAVDQEMSWHFHLAGRGCALLAAMFKRIAIRDMDLKMTSKCAIRLLLVAVILLVMSAAGCASFEQQSDWQWQQHNPNYRLPYPPEY